MYRHCPGTATEIRLPGPTAERQAAPERLIWAPCEYLRGSRERRDVGSDLDGRSCDSLAAVVHLAGVDADAQMDSQHLGGVP